MSPSTTPTRFRLIPLLLALGTSLPFAAQAQSLVELYTAARSYDAAYQSARSQFDATLSRADQAQALLLPTVNLTANANRTTQEVHTNSSSYSAQTATLSASQPLYRPSNVASYEQGKKQADLALAQLKVADQDLIVRVSQAYFDMLAATDSLAFVKSQKAAVGEQLASAKRNFEVGTSTITDQREAQARYDLVTAQELAAENDLRVKSIALDQLVGKSRATPKPLAVPVALSDIAPNDVEQWVRTAESSSPSITQFQVALDVAKLETKKAEAGHKPTVDLVGSYTAQNNANNPGFGPGDARLNQAVIGVNLSIPLFAGYSIQNRVKETLSLEDKARTDLEANKRTVVLATRTAFLGLQSGLAQVKAFQAAEISSQSALDANKLGYQVGVKINSDVLNSQSQLFDTKAKLAKARYDVLVGGLKLRQAAGTLVADDLNAVNALLAK